MKTLLLIDANSFIHRAFHALPPFTGPKGQPTGALYGLTNILLKTLKEQEPGYIAAAFDRPEPTFRKKKYKEYKAHRPKAPDELIAQIKEAPNLFKTLSIPTFDCAGFEADDIIGTLAKKFKNKNSTKIIILTGDLDILQLVENDKVVVEVPRKGLSDIAEYDEKSVVKRFGVTPEQMADYKGLAGDASDNIPGVPNVGPKTAAKLLKEFKNVETLYKKIAKDHPLAKKVLPYKNQALLSKELATIRQDVPVKTSLSDIQYHAPDNKKLVNYLENLGFQSIVKRLTGEKIHPVRNPPSAERTAAAASGRPISNGVGNKNHIIIPDAEFCKQNPDVLESKKLKVAHDWKEIVKKLGEEVSKPIFDIKIAGWLLNPDQKDVSLQALSKRLLKQNYNPSKKTEALENLFSFLSKKIKEYELTKVFEEIEMPLIKVLAAMETWGIHTNSDALKELETKINKELNNLEKKIYKEAGCTLNINSPKQLSEILFEKLKIKQKRTKITSTGQKSTAEEVLIELKDLHPIINPLLEYRESFKIKSTYVEPLLSLAQNGKIHTTYLQTGTATGRIASEKPNLQNIPVDSKWAKPLRTTFAPERSKSFLSFDYSQLELRLLASLSGDEELHKAFSKNLDIHSLTVSKIFKIPLEKVNPGMRRIGKTLNFGIIYGMGPRALSKTANIPLKEAQLFIKEYFRHFPKIKVWQNTTSAGAKTLGYVKNMHGRVRWFSKTTSAHPRIQSEITRMAINMPIQSLSADIIKISMIETMKIMEYKHWAPNKAKLLLSIHDELLFEVADDILKESTQVIKNCMERAIKLSVPLKVETKTGKNWGEMETLTT